MKAIFWGIITTFILISTTASFSWADSGSQALSQENSFHSICSDIQEMYKNRTLSQIQIGFIPPYPEPNLPFSADIDNDGDEETLKYVFTRTFALVMEIRGDETIGLPQANEVTDFYNGNMIIKYNKKIFQLHFAEGLYELQELSAKKLDPDKDVRPIYNVKTLCDYRRK